MERYMMEKLNSMSLYIRRAWDHIMPLHWCLPERIIYDYEILYVKEGEIVVKLDSEVLYGKPGDVFFFRPRQIHSIESIGNVRLRQPHIHFDFYYDLESEGLEIPLNMDKNFSEHLFREDIIRDHVLEIKTKTTLKNPMIFENLIFRLITEQASLNPLVILLKKSILFEMIYILAQSTKETVLIVANQNVADIVKNANEFINRNCNRKISEEEIAKEMGYSKNYFVHIYKNYLGITPSQYHEQIRIESAKNFIKSTKLTISEIALELGFENVYSFSRYFKRLVKISPEHYRMMIKEK